VLDDLGIPDVGVVLFCGVHECIADEVLERALGGADLDVLRSCKVRAVEEIADGCQHYALIGLWALDYLDELGCSHVARHQQAYLGRSTYSRSPSAMGRTNIRAFDGRPVTGVA